ncbi:hypothetical protein [Burkholderia cepacia]|uniref:hypothetical protein n=1 Tax=Burkholderia cepacia TaxID=292 RepID=UPI000AD0B705|nr:hypothetical protein [Burkholderia cepacia]
MQVLLRVACSFDREKLLWQQFTSGTHAIAQSWLSGQVSAMAGGNYLARCASLG